MVWESISSENMLPLFFFCNTHDVVGPVCISRAEFTLASPCGRAWLLRVSEWAESLPPLPFYPRWMNECRVLVPPRFSWVFDGGDDDGDPKPQRNHRRRRSRSVEDDEEGHLIYHSGDMLRERCIEYTLFCIFISFTAYFVFWGQTLHDKNSYRLNFGPDKCSWQHLNLSWCVQHSICLFCLSFMYWFFYFHRSKIQSESDRAVVSTSIFCL